MIPTAPRALRNRLAETILAALHDPAARRELAGLGEASARHGLAPADRRWATILAERARRAASALADLPLGRAEPDLADALDAAAALFDSGLHFEVHELLEPYWASATGAERDGLQGLIQVAVGYQHLANGNLAGARALLGEGSARLGRSPLPGLDTARFVGEVLASLERLPGGLTAERVPRFPGRQR